MVTVGLAGIVMSAFVTLVVNMELAKNLGSATATEAGEGSSAIRYCIFNKGVQYNP